MFLPISEHYYHYPEVHLNQPFARINPFTQPLAEFGEPQFAFDCEAKHFP
jgi:hypothetical protein